MLKKIINMNEPMSRIEYLIVGMVIPIVLIMLSLFFIVMIILEPFMGCALRSMSYQEKTCLQMGRIERTLIMNNLDKLSTTNITIDDFNNLLSKERNEYGLDAWGHKIKFEQYGNGFKLLTVMLDKNESEWVRQIVYNRNIDGVSNGCYVDKGLMERFFCKH